MSSERINYVLYRSSSSLASLKKFKSDYSGFGMTYIKFGWHDLTKSHVLPQYAAVDSIEFKKADDIKPGTLVDEIRKSSTSSYNIFVVALSMQSPFIWCLNECRMNRYRKILP